MKIGVCTLRIGEKFKKDTEHGYRSYVDYCKRHDYDLIDDESVYDNKLPHAWSKIFLILKYLKMYDYLVWLDADAIITNQNIPLTFFIENLMGDKELMYTASLGWINTGVMFIKNTEFMHKFFEEVPKHTKEICWEQGSIDLLYRTNWENCQNKILVYPDQRAFNSSWDLWQYGQFLLHFPGCQEPNRPPDCLRRMLEFFTPYQLDTETVEAHAERQEWLREKAIIGLPLLKQFCDNKGAYFPLDI